MALRTDKAVEIFSALHMNEIKSTEIEVSEARSAIKELAKNPTPNNRYEIAQLMAFVVNNVINMQTNYLDIFADVKRVGIGEKALFKAKKAGVKAYLQAKNGTTSRSRIMNTYTSLDTVEVSARPYVNLYELASGKVNFDECISDASAEMERAMVQMIESTLYTAFSGYSSPSYGSGSGIVSATFDPMMRAMQRMGNATLVGDISILHKLAVLTGFVTTGTTLNHSYNIIDEQNRNGFIGTYKGSSVVRLNNPFVRGSIATPVLREDLLYIIPQGAESPLKVVMEGEVESLDATNINDNTMEVCLRKYFGTGIIFGDNPYLAVYEDTSL